MPESTILYTVCGPDYFAGKVDGRRMDKNDRGWRETPEQRWQRVHDWVKSKITTGGI